MTLDKAQAARLSFLVRVVGKECRHLLDTDTRLFGQAFTLQEALKVETDPLLAERLDAFVSRFGRLQDTLGDKLLPALLIAVAEVPGPAIENLDKAEKFGWIASCEQWIQMRRLRNQMVHEYIEDLIILASALRAGHDFVPVLISAAQHCVGHAERLLAAADRGLKKD